MSRTDLTEKQWRQLEPHLPPNPGHGHVYVEHRHVINGILGCVRTGAIPSRYGLWQTCYDRFVRCSHIGTWQRLLTLTQAAADEAGLVNWDGAALDATHTKAREVLSEPRKMLPAAEKKALNDEWLGRSHGGITSKIHLCVDGHGLPLSILVTAGQCSDAANFGQVLDAISAPRAGRGRLRKRPSCVRVDRAFGARHSRQHLARGIRGICPERQDARQNRLRKERRSGAPPRFDADAYKGENVVERAINRLKDFRAIATRYENADTTSLRS